MKHSSPVKEKKMNQGLIILVTITTTIIVTVIFINIIPVATFHTVAKKYI